MSGGGGRGREWEIFSSWDTGMYPFTDNAQNMTPENKSPCSRAKKISSPFLRSERSLPT